MNNAQVEELLYQALETEQGGQKVYTAAIECASNKDLNEEWKKYLDETTNHERILLDVFASIGLDPEKRDARPKVVRRQGRRTRKAMSEARAAGKPEAASSSPPSASSRPRPRTTRTGNSSAESPMPPTGAAAPPSGTPTSRSRTQEDEHLYHTMGWAGNSGSSRSACLPSSRLRKRRRRSRPRSAPPGPSKAGRR